MDADRLVAVRLESEVLVRRYAEAEAHARATHDQIHRCRAQREVSRKSAAARRRAGPRCIPVIEQAKGIVMARQECGPVAAFDVLRRASQRAGVRVHVLAAQMVEHVASSKDGGNVTPISLGAIGCLG
jgi:hypothetical protein